MLVDPFDRTGLDLQVVAETGDEIMDATLTSRSGHTYRVSRGIPRFLTSNDSGQVQTMHSFGFKWRNKASYAWARKTGDDGLYATWLSEKYGFRSAADWCRHFSGKRILDLGCGAGMASYFWLASDEWDSTSQWVGVDLSEAVDVARENLRHIPNTHFIQGDAMKLPFRDETFDAVLSEGVLHHTPSTKQAIASVARVIVDGGELNFYVYRRKGPAREFTDDYVRERLLSLTDEEAWDAMRSLTMLARSLASMKADVTVEEDVPLLGIKAGRQDVQRLIYWNFAKLYWNDAFDFEENVHVNYDWYRPVYAHRQSEDEIREWCQAAGLEITRVHEQESGFTVRAVKNSGLSTGT